MADIALPTQRLSPKNQVTLPKGARALAGLDSEGYVCGRPDSMLQPTTGEHFRVLVLMTEQELERREEALRAAPDIDAAAKAFHIANLNGPVRRMAVDAQRRIVLPAHFVDYLALGREVYMFSTNVTVLAWHPEDWQRWSQGLTGEGSTPPAPPPVLGV